MILRGECFSILLPFFVLFCALERVQSHEKAPFEDEERAWKEFQEFREWKRSRNDWNRDTAKLEEDSSSGEKSNEQTMNRFSLNKNRDAVEESIDDTAESENIREIYRRRGSMNKQPSKSLDPPPVDQPALMGRYIVNQADWTSVATISSRKDIPSFPVANVISMSDGPLGNGTGIPYMYITPLDFTAQDLTHDHRASLMMTLAQSSYCKTKIMDPMDPRCARIILSGKIKEVKPQSYEFEVAKNAVFGRHPWLAHMPENHHFFFVKLKIGSIAVLDTFGGPKYVSVKDYFNPPIPKHWQQTHHRSNSQRHDENSNLQTEEEKFAYRI